ncbi:hypothetical protein PTKU64_21840 [Paraburkholderia terrae]|uniref:HNH endonuclease n=1 Tax=Paraburkholderia terrae TaxID=311230 RepID=A0ABM7TVE5_9BURK|nr:hypothetical protein [Paraburkholderia terrae]BCZ78509.1 hypothetical protein PTKU64_21840 [Paraburkholderia terrae]
MKSTRAAKAKRLAQLTALEAGLETFAFHCAIHGPEALSDTAHGWCIECRQMTIDQRSAKLQHRAEYRAEYRAENLGPLRAAAAARAYATRSTYNLVNGFTERNLPASYETERETIERFYAKCPEGHQVDHRTPVNGRTVSGLHCASNLVPVPRLLNGMKSAQFDSDNFRDQRPANAFPGGAWDPELTEQEWAGVELLVRRYGCDRDASVRNVQAQVARQREAYLASLAV